MTPTEHQRAYRKRKADRDPEWHANEMARLREWRAAHPKVRKSRKLGRGRLSDRKAPRNRDLLPQEVVAIRERYAAGGVTQRQLARDYLASQAVIGYVVRGQLYADCGGPRVRRVRITDETL